MSPTLALAKFRILFVVTGIALAGCGGGGGGSGGNGGSGGSGGSSGSPDGPLVPPPDGGSPDVPPSGSDAGDGGGVPTIVKEGVKVLPEGVTIVSVGADGTVTLRGNVPVMKPGEVIISGSGEGLARKVMSMSTSGGDVVLATEQATLTDIFEQVDIGLDRMFSEADLSTEPAPPPKQDPDADGGVGLTQQPQTSPARFKMPFDQVLFDHPNGRMRLYGQGSVGIDLGVSINIRPNQEWKARAVPTLTGNFSATFESTLSAWIRNQRNRLAYWRLNPITVQVGVPVVLVPVIEVYAVSSVEANAGFRMTVGGDAMARAGFEWTPSTGMKGIADSRFTPSFQLNGAARMKGDVTLRAELSLLVYGVVGVSGSIDIPTISATVNASGNGFAYAVNGRLGGGVGFNATLLNWKLVDQYIRVFDSPAISLGNGVVQSTGLANSTIEFSPTSNTGRWRYGWMPSYGEAFRPYTAPATADGITAWTDSTRGSELSLYYNGTNQTLHPSGTVTIPPRTVALHPGPGGEYSVLRFVAPVGGRYRFTAIFKGLSGWAGSPATTTSVGVSRGLEGFGGAHLNQGGQGNSAGFNNAVFLDAGDALDFFAGADGDHRWDSTEVHVEIWPES